MKKITIQKDTKCSISVENDLLVFEFESEKPQKYVKDVNGVIVAYKDLEFGEHYDYTTDSEIAEHLKKLDLMIANG